MRYIYGPVQSRRLGLSLGVSLTPYKICNFDCLYCQLGPTQEKAFGQKEYANAEDVIGELRSWLQYNPEEAKRLNYVTLSGMGEPTLNNKIGTVISRIRKVTPAKIALITNSSLLREAGVRQEIMGVDLIVPSLDAADEVVFQDIDRPAQNIHIEDIISGLINLRKEFRGAIWLEVMLVKGLNDSLDHIRKLKEAVDLIKPDKIQLNSPVRAGAEAGIASADKNRIEKIKEILGERCEVF